MPCPMSPPGRQTSILIPRTHPPRPQLPRVLSKSHPFLKMDGTLQTPYAQFSFIILISNYLGWFPALASAAILMPADTLCSLPLLSPPFIQTTEILPTHRRAGNQGGKSSQQAGALGVWSKVAQAPEAVGAAGRTRPGRWEPRVSLKWGGGSKGAVKGAPGPSGNCCLPDRPLPPPPGPHSHPQASPTGADTPSSQTKLPAPTSSSNRLPFCPEDKSQEILLCPLPGGLSPQKPLQRSPLFVPVSPLLQIPPGCLN